VDKTAGEGANADRAEPGAEGFQRRPAVRLFTMSRDAGGSLGAVKPGGEGVRRSAELAAQLANDHVALTLKSSLKPLLKSFFPPFLTPLLTAFGFAFLQDELIDA
jgi:hypothetical protein